MRPAALHVFIDGMVQGVGFRQATARQARSLNLSGWIRNLPDGRVEAWFQGPESDVETMLEWCRNGPALAEVRDVQFTRETPDESHAGFNIRF